MSNNLFMQNIATTVIIISMLFALAKCFFGYKLQRFFSALNGFAIGIVLGALIITIICPKNEYYLTVLLVGILIMGIVGAVVSFTFYKVGVFIYMFSTTFALVYSLLESFVGKRAPVAERGVTLANSDLLNGNLSNFNWVFLIAAFVVAIIVGIITIKFIKKIMIIVTAVSGGLSFSTSLLVDIIKFNNLIVILLVAAAMAVLGITFQFRTTKKYNHR